MVGHILFYTRAVLLILRDFNEPKDNCKLIWMDRQMGCEEVKQKRQMGSKTIAKTRLGATVGE